MATRPRTRTLVAATLLGATLVLAACSGSTTPTASGASSAPAPASSSASASAPTAEATPNGVEAGSADEILKAAVAAAKEQSSVRIVATSEGTDAFDFDLKVSKGQGGYGTITAQGTTLQVVVSADTVYVKGDEAFWQETLGAEGAAVIGDKWLSQSATGSSFSDVASLTDLDQVLDGLLNPSGDITKGTVGEADGQPAVPLESTDGTLWIATTGEPLPLLIEQKGGSGRASFGEWSSPVEVPVPPADQVVTEDQLPLPSLAPSASAS